MNRMDNGAVRIQPKMEVQKDAFPRGVLHVEKEAFHIEKGAITFQQGAIQLNIGQKPPPINVPSVKGLKALDLRNVPPKTRATIMANSAIYQEWIKVVAETIKEYNKKYAARPKK